MSRLDAATPLAPLPVSTLVCTDLIGVTRGRSFPSDELPHYVDAGCGWVPANSALTPQDIIASANPWGAYGDLRLIPDLSRSEEHTSELQSLMRISYAVFCLKKKKKQTILE